MTAIAGLWRINGRPDAAEGCRRMLTSLKIYGPDGTGIIDEGDIALGRQLSRLLPEDIYDRQPLRGKSGAILVADVRIDNREEVAAALRMPNGELRTKSDADLMLAAFERWGDRCFERLVGDYACAIWEKKYRRLLLAVDALGMRPLYFHRADGLIAFASMPKGLHALSEVPYLPDEEHVTDFLLLMADCGPNSFFHGVQKIECGCLAIVTETGFTVRRHWEPARQMPPLSSSAAYAEGLRERLDEAVRCRLRGATDVAAHLSAGYDSAAVTSTAARLLGPDGGRVHAFTAVPSKSYSATGPSQCLFDEGPLAGATSAMYANIDHALVRSTGRSPLENLDRNFFLYDQPMLNLCNLVWTDAIQDEARARKLSVMLVGMMGNMTLSYDGSERLPALLGSGRIGTWFREARALAKAKKGWPGVLAGSAGPWIPLPIWRWANRLRGRTHCDPLLYAALNQTASDLPDLHQEARERELDMCHRPWKDGFAMRLWVIRRGGARGAYFKGVLAGWGIDMRDPTADRRLVEFCLAVPMKEYLSQGQTRMLAKRALADRLPSAVLEAPYKGYQAVDWHEGLTAGRGPLVEEIARLGSSSSAARVLAVNRLRKSVEEWPTGGWEKPAIVAEYRLALLRALSTGHFLRRATGANQ
jgi:asparagine synthase (glutamine-hydrolysing)